MKKIIKDMLEMWKVDFRRLRLPWRIIVMALLFIPSIPIILFQDLIKWIFLTTKEE